MYQNYIIAHLSDIHVGELNFRREAVLKCIEEINELSPSLTIITGDLTNDGLNEQFEEAKNLLDMFEVKPLTIMGNHDARNMGYSVFETFFGKRMVKYEDEHLFLLGVDSSQPDVDEGHIGRVFQENIRNILSKVSREKIKVFALHHHLVPVPRAGRERDIVTDAGDVLKMLIQNDINIVLCGHRHVPWVWRMENVIITHAGTAGSPRLVGLADNSYLLTRIIDNTLSVSLKLIGKKEKTLRKFQLNKNII